jgi:hypothetical protein
MIALAWQSARASASDPQCGPNGGGDRLESVDAEPILVHYGCLRDENRTFQSLFASYWELLRERKRRTKTGIAAEPDRSQQSLPSPPFTSTRDA